MDNADLEQLWFLSLYHSTTLWKPSKLENCAQATKILMKVYLKESIFNQREGLERHSINRLNTWLQATFIQKHSPITPPRGSGFY
jgi:hypothetical protein